MRGRNAVPRQLMLPTLMAALVAVPFVAAFASLAGKHWVPVLDLAMTDLRVRDVGTIRSPLIGLPGRIGTGAVAGSHPGPLSFYLLAPLYRLFGQSTFVLLFTAGVLQSAAALAAVAVMWNVAGRRVGLAMGAAMAVLVHAYGPSILTQPWNPYLPLLCWTLTLVGVWGVLAGRSRLIVVVAITTTLAAQTHVPYAGISFGMLALAAVGVFVNVVRQPDMDRRVVDLQWASAAAAGVILAWAPPLIEQFLHKPGNLRVLVSYFRHPTEPTIGLGGAIPLMLRHFDPLRLLIGTRVPSGNLLLGTGAFLMWIAAIAVAVQLRHWLLIRLHGVLVWATLLGTISMGRIFGNVWYYLTLWAWSIGLLALFATLWTAWAWCRVHRPDIAAPISPRLTQASVAVAAFATVLAFAEASEVRAPEQSLGAPVATLLKPTMAAIDGSRFGALGDGAKYLVTWEDTYFLGAQGYALLNELERHGYHVGTIPIRIAQVTSRRILAPVMATTNIVLAVGKSIDEVASREGATKIAEVDPRTPAQLARYDELRAQIGDELTSAGRADLVPLLDTNRFGLGNDKTVPSTIGAKIDELASLGMPVAVFFVPVHSP